MIRSTQVKRERSTPSFKGLAPASERSAAAARAASVKADTRCEVLLRRALWKRGLRYRLHHRGLPGCPDIVFPSTRLAVFCDGDFWHGRDLDARLARLAAGHNAAYWVSKIRRNVERDHSQTRALESAGWTVLRYWESDILRDASDIAGRVASVLDRLRKGAKGRTGELSRRPPRTSRRK